MFIFIQKTWKNAVTACTAIDMQLATLDNSAKDNTILGYVEQNMGKMFIIIYKASIIILTKDLKAL
jgi:hypothetical protein